MYQPPSQSSDPPNDYQKYYPPPPTANGNNNYQDQSHIEYGQQPQPYGQQPPSYGAPPPPPSQTVNQQPYTSGEKIKPSKGWNDIWATILWLCNLGAFIALAVIALMTYSNHEGSYNGVQSENAYPGLTFDTSTLKIFGFSAIVGFGISLLYLILANLFPKPLIIVTFIGSILVYFGVTIYYFVKHYYSAAIVFLIFSCLYVACFFWWKSRIPFATGKIQ